MRRTGRRRGRGCALALVGLTLAASEAAAAPSARLVYLRNPGAESCPDERAVRSAVAARLGYDPFFPYAPTTLFAEVERIEGGYEAHIKLVDGASTVLGSRELRQQGDACGDIIDTMALSISIAIDPDSLTRPPGTPPPDAVAPEVAAPPASEPEAPRVAPEPPRRAPPTVAPTTPATERAPRVALDLGAAPSLWIGAAPAVSVEASVFARARAGRVSLALEGRYGLPASRAVEGATVETSSAAGALVPCVHFGVASACAVGALGSLRASSRGVVRPRTGSALHAAIGPRAAIELPLAERLSLRVHGDVLVPLTTHTLEIDGASVYTLPRVAASAAIGVVVRAL